MVLEGRKLVNTIALHHVNRYHAEEAFLSFQQGEERGFRYFFHLHYKPLLHFAYSFLNSREAAEDVVEDSFIKLWERPESIAAASAIKPWLYVTVRNSCISVLRRQKHGRLYAAHQAHAPEETAPDASKNLIMAETMHQVWLALEKLPPKCRQVFTMMFVQGKKTSEIAAELKVSESTVKSHKARALELLRKELPGIGVVVVAILIQG